MPPKPLRDSIPTRTAMALMSGFVVQAIASAGEPARDVLAQAQGLYEGHDSRSRLSFRIERPDGKSRRLDFVMLWKRYDSGPVEEKTILFQTFPPSRKGIAYMNWSYRETSGRPDDAWLYLPELRTIRKVVHGAHHHREENGDFELSLLQRGQLLERPLGVDRLTRLEDGWIGDRPFLRIERRPRSTPPGSPYARIVDWIDPSTHRIERIRYFDARDRPVLEQTIEWRRIGQADVWSRVVARNPANGARTTLVIEDVRLDQGLPDRYFGKRRMRLGPP